MKNIPIWQNVKTDKYPSLKEDITTDILIIGGGMTGISTLYHLKDDDCNIVLIERNKIGYGTTSRSSAKITFLQENIYSKLTDNFDEFTARKYYESQKEAIERIIETIDAENIDCEIEEVNSFLYTENQDEIEEIKREKEIIESFGEITDEQDLPQIKSAYQFSASNTYDFHPLKFVSELAKRSVTKNHQIYENTTFLNAVKKDEFYYCTTSRGLIKCKKLVLAMHYPANFLPYFFPLKCYLEKSYLLATPKKVHEELSAININNPILSIRYYKDFYLTIGESHNLCFKNNDEENVAKLKEYAKVKNISYVWSNHDIMTLDNLPYIGLIKDNLYIATGYNTWGMTNGFLAGIILNDLLREKDNKYQELFNPKRGFSKDKLLNYPVNIFSNGYSYLNSLINLKKPWYKNNPYFTKIDGKKVAIYVDEKEKEHIVYQKCPHLKCNLIFNEIEKTWDCPCHGSRFNIDGKCIQGPSVYDISYKNLH